MEQLYMTHTGLNKTKYILTTTLIGSGGEGDVYHAYADIKIAKIYKPDAFTAELEEKLNG